MSEVRSNVTGMDSAGKCETCGALVASYSLDEHESWHRKIKRQIADLEKLAKDAMDEARRAKRRS